MRCHAKARQNAGLTSGILAFFIHLQGQDIPIPHMDGNAIVIHQIGFMATTINIYFEVHFNRSQSQGIMISIMSHEPDQIIIS